MDGLHLMTRFLIAALTLTTTVFGVTQEVDVHRLMKEIRASVAAQMPELPFKRSGEVGPGASGNFFVTWGDVARLDLSCHQYPSKDEAIRQLRQQRVTISAGIPHPLSGVADEAYFLSTHPRYTTYFARHHFVCTLSGPDETTARSVTDIVIRQIDSSVSKRGPRAG